VLSKLDPRVVAAAPRFAEQFAHREPFRHVVVDDFLAPEFATALWVEFPAFERGHALNESGEPGGKAVVERIPALGGSFAQLDALIRSESFRDLIARITGIPALLYDPHYFGGGTHENRAGQDLDPHVDFNRHPLEDWHRRLNLIVYLNPEWDVAWGGALELHSDPRSAEDRVRSITPAFNRCVIFETTEWSWHGFTRIALPPERAGLTRKSVALYFYTRQRPPEELAPAHSTIYVDRPLPERFAAGLTLSEADISELRTLLARRDQHNARLYRELAQVRAKLDQAKSALLSGPFARLGFLASRAIQRLRR
jgi:hypothetical protein